MADRSQIDLVLLESIAGRLRRSGEMLGTGRARSPVAPDAAEATPIFAELFSRLSEGSAGLVAGSHEAGTRAAASDATAGRSVDGT